MTRNFFYNEISIERSAGLVQVATFWSCIISSLLCCSESQLLISVWFGEMHWCRQASAKHTHHCSFGTLVARVNLPNFPKSCRRWHFEEWLLP